MSWPVMIGARANARADVSLPNAISTLAILPDAYRIG